MPVSGEITIEAETEAEAVELAAVWSQRITKPPLFRFRKKMSMARVDILESEIYDSTEEVIKMIEKVREQLLRKK